MRGGEGEKELRCWLESSAHLLSLPSRPESIKESTFGPSRFETFPALLNPACLQARMNCALAYLVAKGSSWKYQNSLDSHRQTASFFKKKKNRETQRKKSVEKKEKKKREKKRKKLHSSFV